LPETSYFLAHLGFYRLLSDLPDSAQRAQEALASVSGKLIEAQEQEWTRIARELHGDINQQLALVVIAVDKLKQNLPRSLAQLRSRMEELGNRTSEVSRSVQALSHRLHSSKLEYLGLVVAMQGFCREFSDQQQVEVSSHTNRYQNPCPGKFPFAFSVSCKQH